MKGIIMMRFFRFLKMYAFISVALTAAVLVVSSTGLAAQIQPQQPFIYDRSQEKPGEGTVSFIVIGDWGHDGGTKQMRVAAQMDVFAEEHNVQFIISAGDNLYNDGVESIHDELWRTSFEDVYTAESLFVPWYAVLGNHDYYGNVQAQIDYSEVSDRWNMPARYFAVDIPIDNETSAKLIFIDTNVLLEKYRKNIKRYPDILDVWPYTELQWLDSTLTASDAEWNIVTGHHPVYSAGAKHGDTGELIANVKPLLEKHGVQVYFSGHDHNLQHLHDDGPVHYVVSGAGARTRRVGSHDYAVFAKETNGFVGATLSAEMCVLEFIDYYGRTLHTVEIKR